MPACDAAHLKQKRRVVYITTNAGYTQYKSHAARPTAVSEQE